MPQVAGMEAEALTISVTCPRHRQVCVCPRWGTPHHPLLGVCTGMNVCTHPTKLLGWRLRPTPRTRCSTEPKEGAPRVCTPTVTADCKSRCSQGEPVRRAARAGSPGMGRWQDQTDPAGQAGTGWAAFHHDTPPLRDWGDLIPGPEDSPGQWMEGSELCCPLQWGRPPCHSQPRFCMCPWR